MPTSVGNWRRRPSSSTTTRIVSKGNQHHCCARPSLPCGTDAELQLHRRSQRGGNTGLYDGARTSQGLGCASNCHANSAAGLRACECACECLTCRIGTPALLAAQRGWRGVLAWLFQVSVTLRLIAEHCLDLPNDYADGNQRVDSGVSSSSLASKLTDLQHVRPPITALQLQLRLRRPCHTLAGTRPVRAVRYPFCASTHKVVGMSLWRRSTAITARVRKSTLRTLVAA